MEPVGRDRQRLLEEGRAAHRDHRYDAAYRALRSAETGDPLGVDDQHLLADAAWWLGLINECLRLTERAHRDYLAVGRIDRAAAQAIDLGGMLVMRGEYALASGWLSRARRLLVGQPPGTGHGFLTYLDLAQAIEEWRLDEAQRGAKELARLGAKLGDETLGALGLLGQGQVAVRCGQVREGFELLDEAMLPVLAGTMAPDWAGHIFCTITATCFELADLNRARQWVEAVERWLERFSDAVMFNGVCRAHSVLLLSAKGDWAAAEEEAGKVTTELRELNIEAVAEAEYQRAEVHRICGRWDEAALAYARAEALGRQPQPGAALLRLARGDGEGAWTAVTDAVSRASGDRFRCVRLLRAQVEIGVATGRVDAAVGATRRLREAAGHYRSPGFSCWADGAEGRVHLAQGRYEDAVAALTRAVDGCRGLGSWYDLAVLEALLAVACHRAGEDEQARRHSEAADAGFGRLRIPRPTSLPTVDTLPPGGLTTREAEVLTHIARGASNRDAARALSVSEATVRRHLANIYLKLGVGSRTAASAWAHENGLLPPART